MQLADFAIPVSSGLMVLYGFVVLRKRARSYSRRFIASRHGPGRTAPAHTAEKLAARLIRTDAWLEEMYKRDAALGDAIEKYVSVIALEVQSFTSGYESAVYRYLEVERVDKSPSPEIDEAKEREAPLARESRFDQHVDPKAVIH